MHILVSSGTGYIGSHACFTLNAIGPEVTVIDNLWNSKHEVLERIARIAGNRPDFFEGDVRDRELLRRVFADCPVLRLQYWKFDSSV